MGNFIDQDEILRASQAMGLPASQPGPMLASNGNPNYAALDQPIDIPRAQPIPAPKPRAPISAPMPGDESDSPEESTESPLAKYMVTKDDLDNAASAKRKDLMLGGIGDALANNQSWGNFFSGKMNPHQDVSGRFKQLAEMEDQPIKEKQTLLAQELKRPTEEMQMRMADPDSPESKIAQAAAKTGIASWSGSPEQKAQFLKLTDGASALQITELIDKNPMVKDMFSHDNVMQKMLMMNQMFQQRQDNFQQSLGLREQSLGLRQNAAYGHEMKQTEDTMLGANRALELVNKIQAKDLVGTSQLKSDLSAALGSMMNGGKPATVYGMSHQEFDSLYGRAQNAYGMLTGSTPGTITDAQLTQLKKDIQALQVEYGKQRDIKYKSFSAGAGDGAKEVYQKRHDAFDQAAQDQYGDKAPATSGKVKVSNGKETLLIDPKDGPAALKDGYKAVQ